MRGGDTGTRGKLRRLSFRMTRNSNTPAVIAYGWPTQYMNRFKIKFGHASQTNPLTRHQLFIRFP